MARGPLAGAAGPGKFSKRTDLNMGSIAYGEGQETANLMQSAQMAKTPDVKGMSRTEMGMAPSQLGPVTPLFAPTERPDDSLEGTISRPRIEYGPKVAKLSDALAQMLPYDDTGEITVLYQEALARGD